MPSKPQLSRELPVSRHFRNRSGFTGSLFPMENKPSRSSYSQSVQTQTQLAELEPSLQSISPGEFYALNVWTQVYRKMLEAALAQSKVTLDKLVTQSGTSASFLASLLETFPTADIFASGTSLDVHNLSPDSRAIVVENGLIQTLCQNNEAAKFIQKVFEYPESKSETSTTLLDLLDTVDFQGTSLKDWLLAPLNAHPDSLSQQLQYIRDHWAPYLGAWLDHLVMGLDILAEESTFRGVGPGPIEVPEYQESLDPDYSPDRDWMPNVVMVAKNTLVWLDQLSREFGREISRLDQIPDEVLDQLKERGFTALWLIGIWERSDVSRTIKQWMGQSDAEASAYSLKRYQVAQDIGGDVALANLRERARQRGIRLASDMVPNHTGLDSDWVVDHPDYFISTSEPPFSSYTFQSGNLSSDPRISIQIEDHYYDHSDAAVVFKAVYRDRNETRYIYHGNDGTSMPWNDTAQLDYLNPEVREAVIQTILHVARQTPIIRFDAAMTLARKHIRRLWYPRPGEGGAIPSRALASMDDQEFNRRLPTEFWREVVNRVAEEVPDTLLLAEAFWMMEGYFVRTLGMHRVYNSAFMNMLKMEENQAYRQLIKNTLEFDPQILKRYVNFLNNPDEETAVVQFGDGDKYFAVTTLMSTLPGLPLFGHGQWEGFHEKYGMEFRRAQWQETPNEALMHRHDQDITPLLKKRWLFAHVERFYLYDLFTDGGQVNENVIVYSNYVGGERTLVAVNNAYESTQGWIHRSVAFRREAQDDLQQVTLWEAWDLPPENSHYLCLQEQRSGLWFLRRVEDIRTQGIQLQLQGYKSQVYWNIHLREADPEGVLSELANQLQGSGIPDLEAALENLRRAKVIESWTQHLKEYLAGEDGSAAESLLQPLVTLSGETSVKREKIAELQAFLDTEWKDVDSKEKSTEKSLTSLLNRIRRWWEETLDIPWPLSPGEEEKIRLKTDELTQ